MEDFNVSLVIIDMSKKKFRCRGFKQYYKQTRTNGYR